jgi:hypothetical protein
MIEEFVLHLNDYSQGDGNDVIFNYSKIFISVLSILFVRKSLIQVIFHLVTSVCTSQDLN